MKKALLWLAGVVIIAVAADFLLGQFAAWYVARYDLGGDYTSFSYLKKDFADDGLVLGSSVALNSLDTQTLTDSTGTSFFNGASNGQTLPFYITALETALNKHRPDTLLLGLLANQLEGEGMGDRYNFLAPYYHTGSPSIDNGLERMSGSSKYLMRSNLYRFNTIWFRILLYRFITPNEVGERGFIAKPVPSIFPHKISVDQTPAATESRTREFEQLLDICQENRIEVIVFFPPVYYDYTVGQESVAIIDSICRRRGLTLYNDIAHQRFANDSTLFYDNEHLNKTGAKIYTSIMLERLKR